jgi:hypothetical protein
VNGQRLDRIGTAAGGEPAARRQRRRDPPAVEPQHDQQGPNHRTGRGSRSGTRRQDTHRRPPTLALLDLAPLDLGAVGEPSNRRSAPSRSSPSAELLAPADAGSARTTTRAPAGSAVNRDRIRCRNRRCTRCRVTDPPTVRPTTKPTLGSTSGEVSAAPGRAKCTTTEPQVARRPRRTAVAKSSRRVSRAPAGSTARYPLSPVRPTARYEPYGVAPRGWHARRGFACATGTRGSSRGDGCSVGTYACPWPRLSFSWYLKFSRCRSQPSGLRGRQVISLPVRMAGTQEYPLAGGRRPERRRPAPVASKPTSRVTAWTTRRYIDGACLHGVLVAAPTLASLRRPNIAGPARQAGTSGTLGSGVIHRHPQLWTTLWTHQCS